MDFPVYQVKSKPGGLPASFSAVSSALTVPSAWKAVPPSRVPSLHSGHHLNIRIKLREPLLAPPVVLCMIFLFYPGLK